MIRIAFTVVAAFVASGCSTNILVRPVDPAEGASGLVYYLPKTLLVVAPKADGTMEAKFEFIPDESNAYSISHSSAMATHTFTPELTKRGFLKSAQWHADSSAVAAEGIAAAQAFAKAKLDQDKADRDKKEEERKGDLSDAESELDKAMSELKSARDELTEARDERQVLELKQDRLGSVSALTTQERIALKEEKFRLEQEKARKTRESQVPDLAPAEKDRLEGEIQDITDRITRIDFELQLDTDSSSEVNKLVEDLAASNTRLDRAERRVLDGIKRLEDAVAALSALDPTHAKLPEARAMLPSGGDDGLTMNDILWQEPEDWLKVPGAAVFEIKEGVHQADLFLLPERRRRVVRLHAVGPARAYTPQMDFDSREPPPPPPTDPAKISMSVVGSPELDAPVRTAAMLKLEGELEEARALVQLWEKEEAEDELKIAKRTFSVTEVEHGLARQRALKVPLRFSVLLANLAENKRKIEGVTFTNLKTDREYEWDLLEGKGGVYVVRVYPPDGEDDPFPTGRYELEVSFDDTTAAALRVFVK